MLGATVVIKGNTAHAHTRLDMKLLVYGRTKGVQLLVPGHRIIIDHLAIILSHFLCPVTLRNVIKLQMFVSEILTVFLRMVFIELGLI